MVAVVAVVATAAAVVPDLLFPLLDSEMLLSYRLKTIGANKSIPTRGQKGNRHVDFGTSHQGLNFPLSL